MNRYVVRRLKVIRTLQYRSGSLSIAISKVGALGFGSLIDEDILVDFIDNCHEHLFYYLQSCEDSSQ